ncbi:biopolymer transporter TolR [Lysobacter concretionis Ko07 = DSM 16239]|jgi:biopolymer transport protein TolR|uniref:Tol-Pal system protein TolR n=1 Tax=Lysobacter concretionis Ko07 = DSM 16239 TaxID=1122185 RepID=A0A0A0ESE3_9GAMM|nr:MULTISPECIES: protein TolR [Lysobacter]KGM53063.1 biopolymer transporter TolR [Lysobacter concretionis Ko07 = DSM 16239]QOD91499.1 protein TolR [Lysobacter sp. CW239]HEU4774429.1 protein TolR [Lysobacter sp.]
MSASNGRRRKRKLQAEINVVPYIDVMLVLLIIFMVTAPLMNLGVDVELPRSNAKSISQKQEPVIVSVDAQGNYFLTLQGAPQEALDAGQLSAKVAAFVHNNPDVPVYVAGDRTANYEVVLNAMELLQAAKVPRVSLLTKPAETVRK